MLDYHTIISNMKMLGGAVQETYNVIAVGGTSLVLHGIKGSTEDVDFIVEGGDTMRFEVSYKRYCGGPIDVSAAGECFGTRLPQDYAAQSDYIGSFGMLTVHALSVIDTIITKSTRSNPRDRNDIEACVGSVSGADVLDRLREYAIGSDDVARRTIADIFGV